MKKNLLILSVFISVACFPQQNADSVYLSRELLKTQSELEILIRQIRELENEQNSLRIQIQDQFTEQNIRDSILNRRLLVQEALNASLKKKLDLMRRSLYEKNQLIDNEVGQIRKGGALFFIIIISLLVISFVYLVYRNHRLKLYLEKELLNTEMKIEDKHSKLRRKMKKKFGNFSDAVEKRLRKKYKLRKKRK